jgi:hypothetical protein
MDGNIEARPAAAAEPRHSPDEAGAPISRILAEVAARIPGDRITLGELAEALGDRAFGLLIVVLLFFSLLPGVASIFGVGVMILGIQMGIGRRTPRFPGFVARVSVRRSDLLRVAGSSSKWLGKVERYVKPRPGFFTSPLGDRIFGWLTAYVAIMLILPGPGTNGPPAFGNLVMALGLVEHDSKVMGWGLALTLAGCAFATGVLVVVCWLGIKALGWMF